jgi:hypothetical protein
MRINTDRIVSVSAMVVGLGSLFVFAYQARLMREVPRSWYANAGESGRPKAVIEITYSSVYGEHWRIRSDRMVPERP